MKNSKKILFFLCTISVIAILIFFGEYSVMGISLTKPAAIATPCALPSFNID